MMSTPSCLWFPMNMLGWGLGCQQRKENLSVTGPPHNQGLEGGAGMS